MMEAILNFFGLKSEEKIDKLQVALNDTQEITAELNDKADKMLNAVLDGEGEWWLCLTNKKDACDE